jgi:hypothetical protein
MFSLTWTDQAEQSRSPLESVSACKRFNVQGLPSVAHDTARNEQNECWLLAINHLVQVEWTGSQKAISTVSLMASLRSQSASGQLACAHRASQSAAINTAPDHTFAKRCQQVAMLSASGKHPLHVPPAPLQKAGVHCPCPKTAGSCALGACRAGHSCQRLAAAWAAGCRSLCLRAQCRAGAGVRPCCVRHSQTDDAQSCQGDWAEGDRGPLPPLAHPPRGAEACLRAALRGR